MTTIPANQTKLTTDEKLNRIAKAVAVIATEMDIRDDEYAATYGGVRVPEDGVRMSLEEQIERILYVEHFTWTAVPDGGLW